MYVICIRYLLPENGEISADESGGKEMGKRNEKEINVKEKWKKKRVKTEAKFKVKG